MTNLLICIVVVFLLWTLWGYFSSRVEQARYSVLEKHSGYEIRLYPAHLVAQTTVDAPYREALNQGFRLVARYIFGGNVRKEAIAMTAPVSQQKGESIAMTAPVSQSKDGDLWKVQFTMPSAYTLETLPKPNNPDVKIKAVPGYRAAAIRFSGFWWDSSLRKQRGKLDIFVREKQLQIEGEPAYLFYNPPWTLPMFRRNEVQYDLETVL